MKYILSIDQGTTSTTALVVDDEGRIVGQGEAIYPQHFPRPGWVEHLALEIKASVAKAVTSALTSAGIG